MRELMDWYGIEADEVKKVGRYRRFEDRNYVYTIVDLGGIEEEELLEYILVSQYYGEIGDFTVGQFVKNRHNLYISNWREEDVVLLQSHPFKRNAHVDTPNELATFHRAGFHIPNQLEAISRLGDWTDLWSNRLASAESQWEKLTFLHPTTRFERVFVQSFPYYLGLAENALQMIVDTEIDELPGPFDAGTVCHERFTMRTWSDNWHLKMPTEWVIDHPVRDVSEWLRHSMLIPERSEQDSFAFLSSYHTVLPFSAFGWRLLYARLLFPLHYLEIVERYRSVKTNDKREALADELQNIITQTPNYERHLERLFQYTRKTRGIHVRGLDWLES
ncbi:MAG: spore coat putative kinase YutH [Bacilli bacterium]